MENTIVFIDAGFLSKLSKHLGKGKYLVFDIIKFALNISNKQNLNCKHIFYYTAPPFQSDKPNNEENKRKENYDKFIKKLSKKQIIRIREGRCQRIINSEGKINYNQKGVDTLMTMDLMSIPLYYKEIKKAILIACDSDFVPVIKHLKELNLKIILYTYYDRNRKSLFSTSNQLVKSVSKYKILTKKDFDEAPLNK